MNQKSVQDILLLAVNLNLDLPALMNLSRSRTGRSFALAALTGAVTTANAEHPKVLQILDIDIFTDAMTGLGQDVATIDAYARGYGLPGAARMAVVA